MNKLTSVLRRWLPEAHLAIAEPAPHRGFSGARLWRVAQRGELFALRRWPATAPGADRLAAIDGLQWHLAERGVPAPRPVLTAEGLGSVWHGDSWWSLARWLPGAADYWSDPRPARLQAALAMLARLHLVAARYPPGAREEACTPRPSPALAQRFDRLGRLIIGDFADMRRRAGQHGEPREAELAGQTLDLAERLAPSQRKALERWLWTPLPLQWCLRDIWHDHVLFTGDAVTGILDFGAAAIESPAGDVARLLGSLVGDDRDGWRLGLAAYEAIRPLSWAEQDVEWLFDSTGVVLSAVNWVHWLIRDATVFDRGVDRIDAVNRLERLLNRLHGLAARLDR